MVEKRTLAKLLVLLGVCILGSFAVWLHTNFASASNAQVSTDWGVSALNPGKLTQGTPPDDHIDVSTTSNFQNITYTTGSSISIPLTLTFFSTNNTSTNITIDPKSGIGLGCYIALGPGKGIININDYITYSYEGTLTLLKDKPTQIVMTINMPKGLWTSSEVRKVSLDLYGVDCNCPMNLHFKGVIYVS
ncbi:MAG: hypothetical protein ABSA11_12155 [Candidatus Bathyarchaeia archaeon]